MSRQCLRIKRLIEAFPDYTHVVRVDVGNIHDLQSELSELNVKTNLQYHLGSNVQNLIYTPENSVGMAYYEIYDLNWNFFEYTIGECAIGPLCVRFDPPHPDWHTFSFDEPTLPALQAKIFQAIYGEDWPKYVDLRITKIQTICVDCNLVKDKLK